MDRHSLIRSELSKRVNLSGDMAEVGVWQGATASVIHSSAPNRMLHLYDTFGQGIVMADKSIDVHGNGDFANTSVGLVQGKLGKINVQYHVGTFPDTFTEQEIKFCFVYSDTDTYFGTKATLDVFATRMVPGGMIMFDDYEWHGCPGVKKAITEFLSISAVKTDRDKAQFMLSF
jgi:O-methyltransferase